MNLRVTTITQNSNAINNIQLRSAELAKYQREVSSGSRVEKASDDPTTYPQLTAAKSASGRLATYAQTVSDSTAVLNSGVSALQDVNDVLVQAKQLALEANDAGTDPASREAIATQLDGLISRTLLTANGQPDGKSLFAGTAVSTTPFRVATTDAQGRPESVVYDGSTDRARTVTGRNSTVDTRYVGSAVFQQPGADVFASLITLRDNLRGTLPAGTTYNQAMTQSITQIDAARTAVGEATGEQSSHLATLDTLSKVMSDAKTDADARTGDLQGTDYSDAVVKMQEAQTALQAIYAVTSQLSSPGLLSFIGQ